MLDHKKLTSSKGQYRTYDFEEVWRKVKDWPYEVSNWGRVRSINKNRNSKFGKLMSIRESHDGYLYLKLCNKGKQKYCKVHILVAETFLGKRPKGKVVNHIDTDKQHNVPDNLEYITGKENDEHAAENFLKSHGEQHYHSKLTEDEVLEMRKIHSETNCSYVSLSRKFKKVTPECVSAIIKRKQWKHLP